MIEIEINLFAFMDFGAYLRNVYTYRHSLDRRFSHRFIAQKLEDNSPSFFQKVIDGERRLSPHQLETLARLLGLLDHEIRYFRVLYLYTYATMRTERELYLEQLISLNQTPRHELTKEFLQYYTHWYNPAIRTILSIIDVSDDLKTLSQMIHPKVSLPQVRESIRLMSRMKVIGKNEQGFWKPTNDSLFVKDAFHAEVIQSYRHQCLDLAARFLDEHHKDPNFQFTTGTMSVSENAHRRIVEKLDKFRAEVRSIVHMDTEPPTRAIQVQTQILPLTEKPHE